jgi:hypothetical protein
MKKSAVLAALLVMTSACNAKLAGTYSGTAHYNASVAGLDARGMTQSQTFTSDVEVDVVVTEAHGKISVDFNGCHFEARRDSETQASGHALDCPLPGAPGATFHVDGPIISVVSNQLGWSWLGTANKGNMSGAVLLDFTGQRK